MTVRKRRESYASLPASALLPCEVCTSSSSQQSLEPDASSLAPATASHENQEQLDKGTKRRAYEVHSNASSKTNPQETQIEPSARTRSIVSSAGEEDPKSSLSNSSSILPSSSTGSQLHLEAQQPIKTTPKSTHDSEAFEDAVKGLYFAPLALLVLDGERRIRIINGIAEEALGTSSSVCIGQLLESYLPDPSRAILSSALEKASKIYSESSGKLSKPLADRLFINRGDKPSSDLVDISISCWYHTSYDDSLRGASTTLRSSHDIYFTISIHPVEREAEEKPEGDAGTAAGETKSNLISEFVLQHLTVPYVAFSTQGKIVGRNWATNKLFAALQDESQAGRDDVKDDEFDLSSFTERANVFDEEFARPSSFNEWPVYHTAMLGQNVPPVLMGVESKRTGDRFILEITGHPIRDQGGKGKHLGGILTLKDITAERLKLKAEAALAADTHTKRICNSIPQMVYIAYPSGFQEWCSDAFYAYTGAPIEVENIDGWLDYIHPDDRDNSVSTWQDAVDNEKLYEVDYRFKRHDGAWRWIKARSAPIRDSKGVITRWYGICNDIHDQVEALSLSRRAQIELESVIDLADVTLWAVDKEGIITIAKGSRARRLHQALSSAVGPNKDATELLGTRTDYEVQEGDPATRNKLIGKSIYDVLRWDNLHYYMKRALTGQTAVEELQVDGRWFRTSFTPMRAPLDERPSLDAAHDSSSNHSKDGSTEIFGVVLASTDITDRKNSQIALEKSMMEKTKALAAEGAAKEASRLKSEFLANMSHEIRTPIAGVIGMSELILDERGLTPELRDHVETILRSAEGLLTVINDVLDFSKVEIGKLEMEQRPFAMERLLMDTKKSLKYATQKKGLSFHESMQLKYKGHLKGDVGRLNQVITNLLTNAIKFTSYGYVKLDVSEAEEDDVRLTVRFDIRDSGCGIDSKSLGKLFRPFSQADSSTARRFGGTGLGLSISKNLVELMGGKIGLESVEGQGSHAWFYIPFLKVDSIEGPQNVNELSAIGPMRLESTFAGTRDQDSTCQDGSLPSRPREQIWVLVAEDNDVNARIASRSVEKMGFTCRVARNGLIALEELKSRPYNLVLMDCQMPQCDGYEATRMIRQSDNPEIQSLPIIALTASAITGDRERALDAGMDDYLSKPVKRSALEASLSKWLFDAKIRQGLAKHLKSSSPPTSEG